MNAFQRLKIEYDGIFGTIKEYTSDPSIMNYLIKLKKAIESADYETICYSLSELDAWYDANIHEILSNQYVFNPETYKKHMALIKDIISNLNPEDCLSPDPTTTRESDIPRDEKIIFVSHKSDDKKYGDALRDFIVGLGVNDSQLIYTSHPLNKIPLDANIYDYLRQHINSQIFMIILWSDKYLESPACLNEMGAAWVTQADYTNIYTPDFSFGNPKYHECAVDTRKMGAVLNGDEHCKANMIELRQKIQAMFDLENDDIKSNYLLDRFIEAITEDSENGQT